MRILHLEDDPIDAELVENFLRAEWPDCQISVVGDRARFLAELERGGHDLILSDYSLASFSGAEGFQLARKQEPETPFIFFSGTIREEEAIDAMRDGAADYVLKERPLRLVTAMHRAIQKRDEARKRREAETRLKEVHDLLGKARDAIVVTDLNHRVVYWSSGAERILGWTSDEAVGRPSDQILGAPATDEDWIGDVEVRNKHGRILILETHVSLVRDPSGRVKARVSISTDVTEKLLLREQFFRAQRLETLGMLAAGIAHDLNNLLAPVLMAPTLLRERANDPRDVRILDILEKSARRGSELVREILSFAHGATGRPRVLRLIPLLAELADFIEESFPASIVLERSIPPDLWPIVGCVTQLHQALLNLCVNAREAMPAGGVLRLRAENATLDEDSVRSIPGGRPGKWVVLHVEDTGMGIPPELLDRIWDPFFTTKGPGKGSGLGLPTVRALVQNHGGWVALDTKRGRGTSFHIHLPAGTESMDGSEVAPASDGQEELVFEEEA